MEYQYNRQGEVIWKKDQNETVHEYTYDRLGRQTADKVTALGLGVDGAVRRISRGYEVRGMLEKLTSFDAATGGNAVNEVLFEYNDNALLVKEYQEHASVKGANTPDVGYGYDASVRVKGFETTAVRN